MNPKIVAPVLFALSAAAVVLLPPQPSVGAPTQPIVQPPPVDPVSNIRPKVEVVFVLDTTGSMAGLIDAAKEKIWSIATTLAQTGQAPEIRMGLVAFRDRGDDYVTRVVDLSSDLDSVYATLMEFQADGGGDAPESVNRALYDAVHDVSWSADARSYKVIFLVGDAPPHMDYPNEMRYPQILRLAGERGIVVNTIQAGNSAMTAREWAYIAKLGNGRYFSVGEDGDAVAIATPFDQKLAELSRRLDATRLYYGSEEVRAEKERKVAATDKLSVLASLAALARRATFNASASGEANVAGEGDLAADVASGRVALEEVAPATLPAPMQAMSPAERETLVGETAAKRDALKREMAALAGQRADYLRKKVEAAGGAENSLDRQIFDALREQAASKGLVYEEDALQY